jgi:hypothetical protein
MCDDGKELVEAGPWQRPRRGTFSQTPDARRSTLMPRTVAAVSVNERNIQRAETAEDGDCAPRAGKAARADGFVVTRTC